jgi:hypothetical protein
MISREIESNRLKGQMGLSPDVEIDTLTLKAMWVRLCAERISAGPGHGPGQQKR